jgi:molybdate transport system regulatory protein
MKISARNQIQGVITHITAGAVNSEVTLELPGGTSLVAIITKPSIDRLGLKVGQKAYAVVKSSDVMIGID